MYQTFIFGSKIASNRERDGAKQGMAQQHLALFLFPLLFLTLLLAGCGPGHPGKEEILNHLNGALNVSLPYQFTDLQPDFFQQSDRTLTVKGSLTGKLKGDLYEGATYEDRIKDLGYDDVAWKSARSEVQTLRQLYRDALLSQIPGDVQNHVQPVLIKIATPSGSDATFAFALAATHGQNGWSFADDQIVPSSTLHGSPRANFGNDPLIIGSDEEKTKDQAYVTEIQTFILAVEEVKKAILAEDEKNRQMLLTATASGKTYIGTLTSNNATWPMGLCISEQQQIGTSISLKGYLYDPADPTHKKDIVGHIEFNPDKAQGRPIRFATVQNDGMEPSLVRPNNGTDTHLSRQLNWSWDINLALDAQGNLVGPDGNDQENLAPKL